MKSPVVAYLPPSTMPHTSPALVTPWDIYIAVQVALLAPLLYLQSIYLWEKEHLQFFPLAFAAAGWFIFKEGTRGRFPSEGRQWMALGLSWMAAIMAALALFLASPWLAQLAVVCLFFIWALGRFASLSPLRITGISGLLLVTVPPPMGWDQKMVQQLQAMSSLVCSRLMDVAQIVHLRRGNVIEIPSKPLFVEEACSGVDSQYALMAVAGVLLLLGNTRLVVSLITIVTVPLWAILGNLLRIFSIVVGLEWFGVDLSDGWVHTLLGLCVFVIAAWAHWSSVQFLKFLELTYFPGQGNASQRPNAAVETVAKPIAPLRSKWIFAIPCALILLAPSGIVAVASHHTKMVPTISVEDAKMFPGENDLPSSIGTQVLSGFQRVSRDRLNLLGQLSNAWVYSEKDGTRVASLDYPFRGWHPLWECYINSGWTRLESRRVEFDDAGKPLDFPYFESILQNPQGDNAVLYFSLFDELGQPYDYNGSFAKQEQENRFSANIFSFLTRKSLPREPLTFQFQLLAVTSDQATEEQLSTWRAMYLQLRNVVYEKSMPAVERLRGK